MKILFQPANGTKKDAVEIDINADELIEFVRKRVGDKTGIDVHKLLLKGVSMKDDRTLRSYDAQEGATVMIQDSTHGQYLPMGVTPAMEKIKRKLDEGDIVEVAPEAKRMATAVAEQVIDEATIPWVGVSCAAYGEKGMRRQMEDEHLICASLRQQCPNLPKERDFALLAVFDGHGGKQVAGFIRTYMAMELGNAFAADEPKEGPLSDKRLRKCVESAFQRLDSRIATELAGCYDGCTASVVLLNQQRAVSLTLGDSMSYLCRMSDEEEIQAIPLQQRQHKCWMMKEKERILRSGGAVENGRINGVLEVSRAFGDITLKKFGVLCIPEYMKFNMDLEKDKYILIACDGFWNAWSAQEALDFTSQLVDTEEARATREDENVDLKACCKDLVQHVLEEKKAQDNVTVLLIKFSDAGPVEGAADEEM